MATAIPEKIDLPNTDPGALASLRALTGQPSSQLAIPAPREWVFSGTDELFRSVYTRCGVSFPETIAVCSALAGEGKTTTALGLATIIAQDFPDRRVLVVETDLRQPMLAKDFDVEPTPGLAECLEQELPIQSAYRPTFLDNLQLVPAGGPAPHAARLLRSSRARLAFEMMRQEHDLVILDIPAVLASSDAVLLTDLADAVVFVVRSGVTPLPLVNKALDQIEEGKLRGVVLNGARTAIPGWLRRLCGL